MKCVELRKMTYAKLKEVYAENAARFAAETLKLRAGKAKNTCIKGSIKKDIARISAVMTEKRKEMSNA